MNKVIISIFNKLTALGTDKVEEEYLKRKIVLSNILSLLIIFCLGLPFFIISMIFLPSLAYIIGVGIFFVLVAHFILNKTGLHVLGRGIIGFAPLGIGLFYGAALMDGTQDTVLCVYVLEFSMAFIACLVYDFRKERVLFVIINIIAVFSLANLDFLNTQIETGIDDSIVREGWFNSLYYICAFVVGFSNIIALMYMNARSEANVSTYFEKTQEQNAELVASEKMIMSKLSELQRAKDKDELDTWMSKGIADASDILRNNKDDIEALCTEMIQYLAKHLKVHSGMIYVLEKDEKGEECMGLKSTYAYDRERVEKTSYYKEDGLIGQSWRDNEHILISNISEDYLRINSGLGASKALHLIILPFKDFSQQKIEAIIELASFKEIKKSEIDFLNKVGEGFAIAIRNVHTSKLTDKLLYESQEMGNVLREQEEELRQNMEEMMVTQEELERQLENSSKRIKAMVDKYGPEEG